MRHQLGEQSTLWIISRADYTIQPRSIDAELGPCWGGDAIGWWEINSPYTPMLLIADADGVPKSSSVYFSQAEALTECLKQLREKVEHLQSRIATFERQLERGE